MKNVKKTVAMLLATGCLIHRQYPYREITMKYVDYVNVKQGTASERRFSHGNTLPLTALPHALAMFAPQTSSERGSWFYHPNDKGMEGIRLTHQASPWVRDWAFLCFMPQDEKLVANAFLRWSILIGKSNLKSREVITPYITLIWTRRKNILNSI